MRRLLVLILILLRSTAAAYVGVGFQEISSLEWEIARAQVVVRGTVKPIKPAGHFEIQIDETLKGEAPVFLRFSSDEKAPWPAVNGESQVLVCLVVKTSGAAANTASEEVRELVPTCSWLVGRLSSKVIRMDGTELSDAASLLAAARQAAALPANDAEVAATVLSRAELPDEIQERLARMSGHPTPFLALRVPKDQRLQDQARRWCASEKWQFRLSGVTILSRHYRDDRSVAPVFQSLLGDPYFSIAEPSEWPRRIEERAWRQYPVRSAALLALDALEMPQPADSELPLLRYQSVHWFACAGPVGLLLLLALFWRFKRISLLATLSILCTIVAAAIVILAVRSRTHCDTWSIASGGADYEVTSLHGIVAFLRVQDDAPPHGLMRRSFVSQGQGFWFGPYLDWTNQSAWRSFASVTGQTGSAGYDFRFVQVPHWSLIALVMLLPVFHVVSRTRRTLQRRARIRSNRCPQCGYDLRAGHARCPECGHF